uniref:Uncharacterized protein n=1 Tax=Arundo donax TaxID=35708 RepID=A0A0A9EAJ0_ARUDO
MEIALRSTFIASFLVYCQTYLYVRYQQKKLRVLCSNFQHPI